MQTGAKGTAEPAGIEFRFARCLHVSVFLCVYVCVLLNRQPVEIVVELLQCHCQTSCKSKVHHLYTHTNKHNQPKPPLCNP